MELAIYHTTDLHGHVFPTNYVDYQELGMLKIFNYIRQDRKNYDGSLLLEGGDLIQGTVLTNYLSKNSTKDNPILKLTEKIGYDAYVMGNHEFNYGLDHLRNSYDLVSSKILNANIEGLGFDSKPYKIFDINGYKIAVFGATTSYIPNWEQEKNIQGLNFLDPVQMYGKYEKEMVDNSDLVVVLYHGGFEKSLDGTNTPTEVLRNENQASQMLEEYSSIDIILSGHQHRNFITKINGVICSQPINNAKNFTKIVVNTVTGEKTFELVEIDKMNIEIDESDQALFTDTNQKLDDYLDQIVGHFDKPMKLGDKFEVRLKGHPYINFLQEVQMDALEADFSSTTLFDQAIGFDKDISIRDILLNYPYPNILKVLEVSGHDLRDAIETSCNYFRTGQDGQVELNPEYQTPKVRNYFYDFFYGLDYKVDLSKEPGQRVVYMKKDGVDLDLDKTYRLIMNNYRSTNTNEYPCYEGKKEVDESILDMAELIVAYVQKNKNIKVDDSCNFIITG